MYQAQSAKTVPSTAVDVRQEYLPCIAHHDSLDMASAVEEQADLALYLEGDLA